MRLLQVAQIGSELHLNSGNINRLLAATDGLDIGHIRVLLALEDGVNLFERLALGLDPVNGLFVSGRTTILRTKQSRRTMRTKMRMSQDPLTRYIFQPMLLRPIGMMKTKRTLPG